MKHRIYWGSIEADPADESAAHILIDLADGSRMLDDWLDERGAMLVQLFETMPGDTKTWAHRRCHLLIDLEPDA